jgi:hypothetical protein
MSMLKPDFVIFFFRFSISLVIRESFKNLLSIPAKFKDYSYNEVVYVNQSLRLAGA